MAKKRARKGGEATKSPVVEEKNTGESQKSAPAKNKNGVLIIGFVVTFVVAFALAWLLFGSGRGSAPQGQTEEQEAPPARTLTPDDLQDFLAAVEAADFNTMSRLGKRVFKKGDLIPNYESLFAEYALDGFPPFSVFGFYTVGTTEAVYRVILTVNSEDNSVESFMAEEMPVVQ